ncbi:glycoside hydrolase family 3 protein [Cellulophaga sp. HaHaR_3_176]|uniref:glycoside hydrolase family 3 protein n=1 Tax=Cellulophaga sp. HaHaR_3_176 TaxID=1942464 RepID=UPI001C1FDFF2|nr:glycoside hydrolase family 3 protein [Cellulophaga sp. HaHaR_3_176]QWX84619.1 glycoside hydrolase family 3 protein [Cellulophaga sp. HaHaR_3_176]
MNSIISYSQAENTLSLHEKIGQLFMPAAFINDSEEEILHIEKLIKEQHIGGLCFFHSRASAATNFEGQKKIVYNDNSFTTLKKLIKRYQSAAKYPLLISIDAEWGLAMRIENTPQYPYAITLGAIQNNTELSYKVGQKIANDCSAAGIHWNLAPVVDINNNPNNPVIGYRSYGEDKNKVTENALAFIKGSESKGVLTCLKHFPGHGDTEVDSHLGLPLITKSKEELLKNELFPFQQLINEGVDSIMAGHLSIPALADGDAIPSSLSKKMLKNLLRDEMNFKGVVISDALNMHAVSKNYPIKGVLEWLAFDAGNDILCFAEHIPEGIETIKKNATLVQIEESFKRIWHLKEKAFKLDFKAAKLSEAKELNQAIATASLTLLKGDITNFDKQNFIGIEITRKKINSTFFKNITEQVSFKKISSNENSIAEIQHQIKEKNNILLAIFPPKVKPGNLFDIRKEEIDFINEILQTKNVTLYLFGNPYVLNHIKTDKVKAVIIAYQNFEEFQENAAKHFLGKNKAIGKVPITIKFI